MIYGEVEPFTGNGIKNSVTVAAVDFDIIREQTLFSDLDRRTFERNDA